MIFYGFYHGIHDHVSPGEYVLFCSNHLKQIQGGVWVLRTDENGCMLMRRIRKAWIVIFWWLLYIFISHIYILYILFYQYTIIYIYNYMSLNITCIKFTGSSSPWLQKHTPVVLHEPTSSMCSFRSSWFTHIFLYIVQVPCTFRPLCCVLKLFGIIYIYNWKEFGALNCTNCRLF